MSAQAERSSTFYLGFLFLPKAKREALAAVYGFCRHVDDIVDSGNLPEDQARKMLDYWRAEVGNLYDGKPTHSISHRLLPFVRERKLPREPFLDLIEGCRMDLDKKRYETFEDLEKYLYGVAVTVGLLCVDIFGCRHTSAEDIQAYARQMGYAFQLTNIMRDVGVDLEAGRVYLPLKEIEEAGYSLDDLYHRRHTPAFEALMKRQYERAKTCYRRARNLLHPLDRKAMTPADVMARAYEEILDEMKALEFRVFFHRVSLSPWRKARLALKAWAFSRGLH